MGFNKQNLGQVRWNSTVEPVLGTLLNFTGMKKIYARGIEQAEKHVLMASLCYNLKKMMKFRTKKSGSGGLCFNCRESAVNMRFFEFCLLSTSFPTICTPIFLKENNPTSKIDLHKEPYLKPEI